MCRLIALLILVPTWAMAEVITGTITSEITAIIDESGNLGVTVKPPILFDDGRRLDYVDGKWKLVAAPVLSIKDLSAIDLAVYGPEYVGKRVRVTGARFVVADVTGAQIMLPGARYVARFSGMPCEAVKRIVENCSSLMPSNNLNYAPTMVGTVQKSMYGESLDLIDLTLEVPAHSVRKSR